MKPPYRPGLIEGLIKCGLIEMMLKLNGHFLSLLKACAVRSSMWLELDLGQVHCKVYMWIELTWHGLIIIVCF